MRNALAAAALAVFPLSGALAAEADLVGTWTTDGGDSRIRVVPCGTAYCGTIVWAKTNDVDRHNPDASLRKRPVVGITLTKNMKADGSGSLAGSMYNPENGKTYEVTMRSQGRDGLEVGGCVLGFLCGSETWTRHHQETASAAPAR
jgi:uncharacterized protein (DUF2147 family)